MTVQGAKRHDREVHPSSAVDIGAARP